MRYTKPKYKKGSGPPPARSAATKELAKELGLPWVDINDPDYPSDDIACDRCKKIRRTILVNTTVSAAVPSGIERLCEDCK